MSRATAAGKPASNKREDVLAAAVACFAAHGLAGTGMRDVARAAGLTEGTLYHYFPSKDALIASAFQWSAFQASDVRGTMRVADRPLRARLLAVGTDFLQALRRQPEWTRVILREALRAPSDAKKSALRASLVPLAADRVRAVTAALRDEMAARRIRRCDPRLVAEHLFRALIGHFVADAIGRTEHAHTAEADPFLEHLVDTIAASLEPRRSPGTAIRTRAPRRPRKEL